MRIQRLVGENFRNYEQFEVNFDLQLNIIFGFNAQGKSNLLESICYLSLASSFRGAADLELIHQQRDYFYLAGEMGSTQTGDFSISAAYNRQKRRKWRLNQQPCQKLSDIVGVFHTVIFSPEDILLIKGGPSLRRRFLNRQMRNHCLKQGNEELLTVWDQQLIDLGVKIVCHRVNILKHLQPLAAQIHQELSGGEQLTLFYQSAVLPENFELDYQGELKSAIQERFMAQLKRLRRGELARGLCLCGPHRDDVLIAIDGNNSRNFASQGQQRTAALSLKLAELELARQIRGEYPVLLLDDVLSELDSKRQKNLVVLMTKKTQTFITTTDKTIPFGQGKLWTVDKGHLQTKN
ncbi:MAG: DNA replication/repair protein RecF [Clostridiales bacterium]